MARIVFFETEPWEEQFLSAAFPQDSVAFSPETLESTKQYDKTLFDAEILSVFAFSQVSAAVLATFSNLKCIVTRSAGFDHIDLSYCKEKGIIVCNVPAYGVHTVAEHTFALMLAVARKLIVSVQQARKGNFELTGLTGVNLYGKTLGVIGAGNIGTVVCEIARGMGMQVVCFNRKPVPQLEQLGVRFVDLDTLLAASDVLTLHVPATPETKHMINMDNIEKIKKGAILVNTARGPIVETQAIVYGLEHGILSGAGLDVLEEEASIREERELLSGKFLEKVDLKTQLLNHVLLNRDDVVITPHNGFNTKEALEEILTTTVADIKAFANGTPQNVVS
ncbi:MAG: hydroxyacid dehydrogenase [Patescibacteria group bacterium]|nr:hydroxyacid dehydrogenase [Patescibacteria group bacterium]MDE2590759.1 hydroxyacid dehydrogenase [Patescibacteria group bacterium]